MVWMTPGEAKQSLNFDSLIFVDTIFLNLIMNVLFPHHHLGSSSSVCCGWFPWGLESTRPNIQLHSALQHK